MSKYQLFMMYFSTNICGIKLSKLPPPNCGPLQQTFLFTSNLKN